MEFKQTIVGYAHRDEYRTWLIIPKSEGFEASYKRAPEIAYIFISPTEAVSGYDMIKASIPPWNFETLEEAIKACQTKLRVLQRTLN